MLRVFKVPGAVELALGLCLLGIGLTRLAHALNLHSRADQQVVAFLGGIAIVVGVIRIARRRAQM